MDLIEQSVQEKENIVNNFNIIKENINLNDYSIIKDFQIKKCPEPNFFFKENIVSHCDCTCGLNESFDIFKSVKNNEHYLIISNRENNNIEIINIISKEIIKSIEGNNSKFVFLKYYLNPKNNNEYLVTIDINGIIKIINISDNYNIISKIISPKEFKNCWSYLNCALLFNIQIGKEKLDIILVGSRARYMEEYPTKIYNIHNGQFLKDISNTIKNKTRFIIPWYNESNQEYYLIELCEDLLVIVNILHNEIYAKFDEENFKNYSSGLIYKNNNVDYLYASNSCSEINIWNLLDKVLIKKIKISNKINNIRLYGLLIWNENYMIVNDDYYKAIRVIDLKQNKVVSMINNRHKASVRCIKRINHPEYGECLLTGGDDHNIKLWYIPKIIRGIFEKI